LTDTKPASRAGEPIKYMDVREFVEGGFLQEVNRRVLHPAGLALEVRSNDGINWELSGVWDYRGDVEGITYVPGTIELGKAVSVSDEQHRHADARIAMFGDLIQPVELSGTR